MKMKKNEGFVAIDTVVAVIAIMIFSVLIVTLMHTNFMGDLKIRRETLATIYLTETLEKIGIAQYDEVTTENVKNFIPDNMEGNCNITIDIYEDVEEILGEKNNSELEKQGIIKKVVATFRYKLLDKSYEYAMERIKMKE